MERRPVTLSDASLCPAPPPPWDAIQWAAQLGAFTDMLAATGATLIYATMTPFMPEKYATAANHHVAQCALSADAPGLLLLLP